MVDQRGRKGAIARDRMGGCPCVPGGNTGGQEGRQVARRQEGRQGERKEVRGSTERRAVAFWPIDRSWAPGTVFQSPTGHRGGAPPWEAVMGKQENRSWGNAHGPHHQPPPPSPGHHADANLRVGTSDHSPPPPSPEAAGHNPTAGLPLAHPHLSPASRTCPQPTEIPAPRSPSIPRGSGTTRGGGVVYHHQSHGKQSMS